MSRSKRLPIIKDKPRNQKRTSLYWRPIRRIWKEIINSYKYEDELYPIEEIDSYKTEKDYLNRYSTNDLIFPESKTIINDYTYSDYTFDYRKYNKEDRKHKFSRK